MVSRRGRQAAKETQLRWAGRYHQESQLLLTIKDAETDL